MYRKLYFYICDECKKKRQSFTEAMALGKYCGKCKRTKVPENQTSIFDALNKVNNPVGNV